MFLTGRGITSTLGRLYSSRRYGRLVWQHTDKALAGERSYDNGRVEEKLTSAQQTGGMRVVMLHWACQVSTWYKMN